MKKKILYIHHAGGMGGAPRSLAFLIDKLDFNKYEPVIWMMRDGEARSLFEKTGAKVICNTNKYIQPFHGTTVSGMNTKIFIKNTIGYFFSYFTAKKIIREVSPDIIHLSTTCLFQFAKAAKKINKSIKVICHIREPLLPNFFGNILLIENKKYVDEFIAISENDAKPFVEKKANVKVVFNFVDISEYKFDDKVSINYREKLNCKGGDLIISFFARVSASNGVMDLLEIAKRTENLENLKYFVFGFTGETEYEKKIQKFCPSNVKLMPMTTKVKEYLMASNIVISPFTEPHFSRSIVEGSAMGIP